MRSELRDRAGLSLPVGLHGPGNLDRPRASARRTRSGSTSGCHTPTTGSPGWPTTPARSTRAGSGSPSRTETMRRCASTARAICGSSASPSGSAATYTHTSPAATGLVFDHVRFRASSLRRAHGRQRTALTFRHCEFDGGKPDWYFRNDGKAQYTFLTAARRSRTTSASRPCAACSFRAPDTGTTIHHCEFHDAHDLYLGGDDVDFHHNWIHDLNDEGLFLDAYGARTCGSTRTSSSRRCRRSASPAETTASAVRSTCTATWSTCASPPRVTGRGTRRHGRLALRQHVQEQRRGRALRAVPEHVPRVRPGRAGFLHALPQPARQPPAALLQQHLRRGQPGRGLDRPITFIPSPSFPAQTDGNAYHRIGRRPRWYRYLGYQFRACRPGRIPAGTFDCLGVLGPAGACSSNRARANTRRATKPTASKPTRSSAGSAPTASSGRRTTSAAQHESGPRSRHRAARGSARTGPHGSAPPATPDIGRYPFGSEPLQVGVNGRRAYPASP